MFIMLNVNFSRRSLDEVRIEHSPHASTNIYLNSSEDTNILTKTFLNQSLLNNNSLNDLTELDIQTDDISNAFNFLRRSTITSFFASNMVDMPVCFKKSKSLYSKTFELPLLKFTNMLMRAGKRGQTVKHVTISFTQCFHQIIRLSNSNAFVLWQSLLSSLKTVGTNNALLSEGGDVTNESLLQTNYLNHSDETEDDTDSYIKTLLFDKLSKYTPLFGFYIRRVDKSIRKNSRGKSGKYTMIWKYVPVYKRLYMTTRWLLKDLRFQKLKTFPERLIKTLETFLLTPHLSFVCKLRKFTHFFVFQNFKNTLLRTLRSTS
jgi:hypothetical protein